jgi:hypothetical protein
VPTCGGQIHLLVADHDGAQQSATDSAQLTPGRRGLYHVGRRSLSSVVTGQGDCGQLASRAIKVSVIK